MKRLRFYMLAIFAVGLVVLFSPGGARADSLTGSVGITWLFPDTGTVFATDSIAVGSSLSCPGGSAICTGIDEAVFSVGADSISYSSTENSSFTSDPYNGFDFTGLTFQSGTLSNVSLSTNIGGLNASDVTFGSNFVEINLEGLSTNGNFTLTLTPSGSTATPEPSSIALLGVGLFGLLGVGAAMRKMAIV